MDAEVKKIYTTPKEVEPLEVDDIVDFVDSDLIVADQHLAVDKWVYTAIRQELGVNDHGQTQAIEKLEKETYLWLLRVFRNKMSV